jgi:hypothetical protein
VLASAVKLQLEAQVVFHQGQLLLLDRQHPACGRCLLGLALLFKPSNPNRLIPDTLFAKEDVEACVF